MCSISFFVVKIFLRFKIVHILYRISEDGSRKYVKEVFNERWKQKWKVGGPK